MNAREYDALAKAFQARLEKDAPLARWNVRKYIDTMSTGRIFASVDTSTVEMGEHLPPSAVPAVMTIECEVNMHGQTYKQGVDLPTYFIEQSRKDASDYIRLGIGRALGRLLMGFKND